MPTDTRTSLHAVAELLMAGPQYRSDDTIRLRVTPGGFGTKFSPQLRVDGGELVAGDRRLALDGTTVRALGESVGVEPGAPGLYADGSGVGVDDVLTVDAAAAGRIADAFRTGEDALRILAPELVPTLWPEHFDLAVRLDEVNYGVSAGDGYLDEPYAYVGTGGAAPVAGDAFWNAPFGAARPMAGFPDANALLGFFRDGRRRTAG